MNRINQGNHPHSHVLSSSSPGSNLVTTHITDDVSEVLEGTINILPERGEEVAVRTYLLRHYPYVDTPEWREYEKSLDLRFTLKSPRELDENNKRIQELKETGKINILSSFEELPSHIQGIYNTILMYPERVAIFYDENPGTRTNITGNNLVQNNPNLGYVGRISLPGGTQDGDRGDNDAKRDGEITDIEIKTRSVVAELNKQKGDQDKIDTIVIIGNRSYAEGFDKLNGERTRNHQENEELFETNSYLSLDYDKNLNKIVYLLPRLHITPHTIWEVLSIMNEIEGGIFPLHLSSHGAQNMIEGFFHAHVEKFATYFGNPRVTIPLKGFCLANLIQLGEYEVIEKYYNSESCKKLSREEKIILLKNSEKPEVMNIVRRLFVCKSELWGETNDLVMFETELGRAEFEKLSSNQRVYQNALDIQSRSLDEMIKKNNSGSILERNTYNWRKKKTNYNTLGEENEGIVKQNIDFEQILRTGGKYILRAHVGQGKSIWLTEFIKYAILQNKDILFYEAKLLGTKSTDEIDQIFKNAQEKGIVLCIDAIDEITNSNKKEYIKKLINVSTGDIVITARESEYAEKNTNFTTLIFEPIDSETFLRSRFEGDESGYEKVKALLEKNHLEAEIKSNPLLLTFVTLLAKMKDREKEEYKKLNIQSLEIIQNKSDLYESVVRFMLSKHAKDTKGQNFSKIDLENWMDYLGQYAFDIHCEKTQKETDDYFDIHLSILFKNIGNAQYEFMHKSFYEYFLARYLAKLPNNKGSQIIYNFRDNNDEKWNEWREFRPVVLFYAEELIKNGNYTELVSFMGENGLFKNDDIYGENFFMGLEILLRNKNYASVVPIAESFITNITGCTYKADRVMKLNGAAEIMKRYNFTDSTGVIEYIIGIQKRYLMYGEKTSENYLPLARIGDKESIDICCNQCVNKIQDIRDGFMRGKFERKEAENLILQLLEIGSDYAYRQLIKIGLILIGVKEIRLATTILSKILDTEYREYTVDIMFDLMHKGDFEASMELLLDMISRGNISDYIKTTEYLKALYEIAQKKGMNPKYGGSLFNAICIRLPQLIEICKTFQNDTGKNIEYMTITSILESIGNLKIDIGMGKIFKIKDEWDKYSKIHTVYSTELKDPDYIYEWSSPITCENIEIVDNNSDGKNLFYLYLELANRNGTGSLDELTQLLYIDLGSVKGKKFLHKKLSSLSLEKIHEMIFNYIRKILSDTTQYRDSLKIAEDCFILFCKCSFNKDVLAIINFWKTLQGNDNIGPGVTEWLNHLSRLNMRISSKLINS